MFTDVVNPTTVTCYTLLMTIFPTAAAFPRFIFPLHTLLDSHDQCCCWHFIPISIVCKFRVLHLTITLLHIFIIVEIFATFINTINQDGTWGSGICVAADQGKFNENYVFSVFIPKKCPLQIIMHVHF